MSSTVVQVSMDLKTKKKLDYLVKKSGDDSPASFIRRFIRKYYDDSKYELPLNEQSKKDLEQSLKEYKAGKYTTVNTPQELIEALEGDETD